MSVECGTIDPEHGLHATDPHLTFDPVAVPRDVRRVEVHLGQQLALLVQALIIVLHEGHLVNDIEFYGVTCAHVHTCTKSSAVLHASLSLVAVADVMVGVLAPLLGISVRNVCAPCVKIQLVYFELCVPYPFATAS